ncbi:MAG: metal-dependent transcriptional regulator [Candidatus Omnitrophica bacterium]|nr:metal-dependent transcriptional regulator [Candidatus Omnitrophota bacterium]
MEDYLEVILALAGNKGVARVGEIAVRMDVKSPSVNAALKLLADRGLVIHEKYGYVTLTREGRTLAAGVQEKHDLLYRFLTEILMLKSEVAEKEACSIEHAISKETSVRLVKFLKFLKLSPDGIRPKLLQNFAGYLKIGERVAGERGKPLKR